MTKMLRVGLVGCGGQARLNLAPAFARIESARLVSCADVDEARAQQLAEALRIEKVHVQSEEVTGSADVDAVIVAVPHRFLKDVALSAIGAGKHVFIEKPMGLNAAEGAEVVDAAARRGVVAMVGYCMRYSLSRMFIKSLLDRGRGGRRQLRGGRQGGRPAGRVARGALRGRGRPASLSGFPSDRPGALDDGRRRRSRVGNRAMDARRDGRDVGIHRAPEGWVPSRRFPSPRRPASATTSWTCSVPADAYGETGKATW